MAPLAVHEIVLPGERRAALAMRWTNPVLLAPVVGAFLQILCFRQAPSIVWPFLVLAAAVATRILKSRGNPTERPAVLGDDGVALEERFIGAPELASLELDDAVLRMTTRTGEQLELRVDRADLERAKSTLSALTTAMASRPADLVGARILAGGHPSTLRPEARRDAYREPAFDMARCLAVAEDTAAATEVRISAAARLANGLTDDADARVRVSAAAEATASPELREALLSALEPPRARRQRER